MHHNLSWFEKNMYIKVSIIYGLFSKLKKKWQFSKMTKIYIKYKKNLQYKFDLSNQNNSICNLTGSKKKHLKNPIVSKMANNYHVLISKCKWKNHIFYKKIKKIIIKQ